jgi:hypothetical protein
MSLYREHFILKPQHCSLNHEIWSYVIGNKFSQPYTNQIQYLSEYLIPLTSQVNKIFEKIVLLLCLFFYWNMILFLKGNRIKIKQFIFMLWIWSSGLNWIINISINILKIIMLYCVFFIQFLKKSLIYYFC